MEKSLLEENILHMLYQCGLFLKQSGLFEQLWTLLRMYLDLNLAPTDKRKFHIESGFDEKQLVELEEVRDLVFLYFTVVLNSTKVIFEFFVVLGCARFPIANSRIVVAYRKAQGGLPLASLFGNRRM